MNPLVEKAYRDRELMEEANVNYFPIGANNISSCFKREGEGFFEPGSSPLSPEESDLKSRKVVWDEDYTTLEAESQKKSA